MGSHLTKPFPVKPGLHMHDMVRSGRVSCTLQLASLAQGSIAWQGFLHSSSIHASWLSHCESVVQSGSIIFGTAKKLNFDFEKKTHMTQNLLQLTFSTGNTIGVTSVSRLTGADTPVISGLAIGMPCTITRIHTLFIPTCKCCWTLWICDALWPTTRLVWVSKVVWWAYTRGPVVLDHTLSICATSFINTRILTFSVYASLSEGAFIVTLASS